MDRVRVHLVRREGWGVGLGLSLGLDLRLMEGGGEEGRQKLVRRLELVLRT